MPEPTLEEMQEDYEEAKRRAIVAARTPPAPPPDNSDARRKSRGGRRNARGGGGGLRGGKGGRGRPGAGERPVISERVGRGTGPRPFFKAAFCTRVPSKGRRNTSSIPSSIPSSSPNHLVRRSSLRALDLRDPPASPTPGTPSSAPSPGSHLSNACHHPRVAPARRAETTIRVPLAADAGASAVDEDANQPLRVLVRHLGVLRVRRRVDEPPQILRLETTPAPERLGEPGRDQSFPRARGDRTPPRSSRATPRHRTRRRFERRAPAASARADARAPRRTSRRAEATNAAADARLASRPRRTDSIEHRVARARRTAASGLGARGTPAARASDASSARARGGTASDARDARSAGSARDEEELTSRPLDELGRASYGPNTASVQAAAERGRRAGGVVFPDEGRAGPEGGGGAGGGFAPNASGGAPSFARPAASASARSSSAPSSPSSSVAREGGRVRVSADLPRARKQTARLAAASAAFVVPGGTGARPPARTARIAAGSGGGGGATARARESFFSRVATQSAVTCGTGAERRRRSPRRGVAESTRPTNANASSAPHRRVRGETIVFARVPAEVPGGGRRGRKTHKPASGGARRVGTHTSAERSSPRRSRRPPGSPIARGRGRARRARAARAGALPRPGGRRAPRRRRAASSYRCPARHRASATSLSAARSRRASRARVPGSNAPGMRARARGRRGAGAHGGAAVRVRRRARRVLGGVAEQGGRASKRNTGGPPTQRYGVVEGADHPTVVRSAPSRRSGTTPGRSCAPVPSSRRRLPQSDARARFILASPSGRPTRVAPHTRVPRSPESPIRVTSVSRTSLG